MKNLYLIGGTMGVGKTAACQRLKKQLCKSVFLDGDWCWDADPFIVTDETKKMVMENICFLLNQFLKCSEYENIIFCWVMHQQSIIDEILGNLSLDGCNVKSISLTADEASIRARLEKDVENGIRTIDVIDRSIQRIGLYDALATYKVDTSDKSIDEVCELIKNI